MDHLIKKHSQEENILNEEQKGCRIKRQCCKEQLKINRFVTKDDKKRNKYITVAWIEYRKTIDNVTIQ